MLARGSRKSSVIYPPLITFGSCSVQEDARFWVLQLILPSRQVIFIPTPREGGRAVSINHPTEDMLCWTRPRRTKEWIFPPPLSSPCTDPTFKVSRCLRCSLMEQQYIKKTDSHHHQLTQREASDAAVPKEAAYSQEVRTPLLFIWLDYFLFYTFTFKVSQHFIHG